MGMVTGTVAFSVLTTTDFYKGKDTGYHKLTVTLDDESAEQLQAEGVKLKEYEGTFQRQFKTKHPVDVIDTEDNPFTDEIPRGSKVRVLYGTGPAHPEHGVPVYLNKVRLVELSEGAEVPDEF